MFIFCRVSMPEVICGFGVHDFHCHGKVNFAGEIGTAHSILSSRTNGASI